MSPRLSVRFAEGLRGGNRSCLALRAVARVRAFSSRREPVFSKLRTTSHSLPFVLSGSVLRTLNDRKRSFLLVGTMLWHGSEFIQKKPVGIPLCPWAVIKLCLYITTSLGACQGVFEPFLLIFFFFAKKVLSGGGFVRFSRVLRSDCPTMLSLRLCVFKATTKYPLLYENLVVGNAPQTSIGFCGWFVTRFPVCLQTKAQSNFV